MKHRALNIATLITLMVVGLAVNAAAGGRVRQVRHAERATSPTIAIAALSPVGGATGWGRVSVADVNDGQDYLFRSVTVRLFGLQPSSPYEVAIDDVDLGQIYTDGRGWAFLVLQSPSNRFPPVPDDLPPVASLQSVAVTDASGAFVLEGTFVAMGGGGGSQRYVERIVLEDVNGNGSAGIAKVEAYGETRQSFETRAAGLEPGQQYSIVVDGFQAGLVTADAVGQARLHLATNDDENPLPPELQPVQDIRQVEWRDANGDIVLSGTFTGTPDNGGKHRSATGPITEMAANGFTFMTRSGPLQVVIDENTVFENFSSLADLAIGDMVKVEGSLDGSTLTASSIELMRRHGEQFGGIITAIASDGFTLQSAMGDLQVVVTA
ncbi:MAG TPA: hypothetical protein ENK19_08655, partial [Acidobacteria bacterium]|nr:hypothetical protein [Acidobacteriota bacterium]